MDNSHNVIESIIRSGVVHCKETDWSDAAPMVERLLAQVKQRVVLFLGAATSSLKPAKLPMWDKFIELLWSSMIENAVAHHTEKEDLGAKFTTFFRSVTQSDDQNKIPNYLFTEIISRRLGTDYLNLLEAFEAQKSEDGRWAVNGVHKWAAEGLIHGKFAAVMTTNFDDYLEKAIQVAGGSSYQITGNPHIDGEEITSRVQSPERVGCVVLVVNGAKAFSFVRSMMPQIGMGKLAFLFKLHGSCYEPETCIDTRLQRSQGLPSYLIDVLDTLLERALWFVAGFSGSDMNDNLDYLRIISNKKHARLVWLHFPGGYVEEALRRLQSTFKETSDLSGGLCLLPGYFVGSRTSSEDKFPDFDTKVKNWSRNLGPEWCRLVLIDLLLFVERHSGQKVDPRLLKALNDGEIPRQDWNKILEQMDRESQQPQAYAAKLCKEASGLLSEVLDLEGKPKESDHTELCLKLNTALVELNKQHLHLQNAAGDRPHAQTWVVSALCGLILICGNQLQVAVKAFEASAATAWLVGDFQIYQLLKETITEVQAASHTSKIQDTDDTNVSKTSSFVALIPAMDNINAKMNRFGIPPASYIRALLHRSILFADGMAVPPNILANSTVFLDEVLFQGDLNVCNETYLQHLFPMMPLKLRNAPQKLQAYRNSRHASYIKEPIDEEHLRILDRYFDMPVHADRFIFYDEDEIRHAYGRYIRAQLETSHAPTTVQHLTQLWNHTDAGGWWNASQQHLDRSSLAANTAQDLIKTLAQLSNHLPKDLYRSTLYRFADLFDQASDRDAFLLMLDPNIPAEVKENIISGHERIIDKPWLYGPLCHEIFDLPYQSNLAFDLALKSNRRTFVFLEDDEVPSWQFMSLIRSDSHSLVKVATSAVADGDHKCSCLLLGQASTASLTETRRQLAPIRSKLASSLQINAEDKASIRTAMSGFTHSSLNMVEGEITDVLVFESRLKELVRRLLTQCIFLVRRGPALARMYEEAYFTVPGLLALRREEREPV